MGDYQLLGRRQVAVKVIHSGHAETARFRELISIMDTAVHPA